MKEVLSLKDIANYCGVTPQIVHQWIRDKKLVALKDAGLGSRILPSDLKKFLQTHLNDMLQERRRNKDTLTDIKVLTTLCALEQNNQWEKNPLTTKQLLIVDDSPSYVEKTAEFLTLKFPDIFIHQATSAFDGCRQLIKYPMDIILVDILMPTMDGVQFCQMVRSLANRKTSKILVVSGMLNDEIRQQLEEIHITDFLEKPFKLQLLQSKVEEILNR
jgi:CheY-like chemotaxis protein